MKRCPSIALLCLAACTNEVGAPLEPFTEVALEPGGNGTSTAALCNDVPLVPTSAPLRRLTVEEYENTLATLFPGVELPALALIEDSRKDGFTNNVLAQGVSALAVERLEEAASSVASAAVAELSDWSPCMPEGDGAACAREIATVMAERAFRRPLSVEERAELEGFVDAQIADAGFEETVRMTLWSVLESPMFQYRPEVGDPSRADELGVPLTDHELATRLAFFLTRRPPDDALYAAANRGELRTPQQIRAQTARLMQTPAAVGTVRKFFEEWLHLDRIEVLSLDPALFPGLDDALRADLHESIQRFTEAVFWEEDDYDALFTARFGYVNDRLAEIFGVPAPGTDELVRVPLDPTERAGLLTQPGLLASTSHGIAHSPIMRGVVMLESILCAPAPAPPPGILENFEPVEVPEEEICTTRDKVAKTHTVGASCQTCHVAIDGAGFLFERFDALGRYREVENDCDVDATGELVTSDLDQQFDGAVEMSEALPQSDTVAQCVASHWYRYALGKSDGSADRCQVAHIAEVIRERGFQEAVTELVTSPFFTHLPAR